VRSRGVDADKHETNRKIIITAPVYEDLDDAWNSACEAR
jgi:hypothetical protein